MDSEIQTWLTRANTALIRYPRFKALHQDMRECQALSRLANEPHCLSLEGVTGAGKSTLVRDYAALFPRVEEPSGTRVPVFYAETPSPVTVKGMAATMLARLGDPAAHTGALWSMNFRLVHLMTACQVELVILDDFHHLIDKETNCILEQVSDWLKVLIKETNIPFLVVGIEGKVECILEANSQLSRLFAARQTLEPFRYDQADDASLQEFARFVHYAEEALAIALPETLPRAELLQRLHVATRGVVGNLMNLLRYAAWLTRQQQHDTIALPTLAAAFDKRLRKHLKSQLNPFTVPPSELITTALMSQTPTTSPPKRKRRASAAEVLRT
jgi:Bacterial TniB protein